MSGPPPARPIHLELSREPVFGMLHEPSGRAAGTTVMLCSPWGWEDVASYRSRRSWAQQLARAGHRTLRFDLPATGDSAGSPADPRRVDAWSAAITAAAAWLRGAGGCERVAAVGLGLSGLIACRALAAGAAIDDLVLWGAPVSGRAFLREQRALARFQRSLAGDPKPSGLPDGWIEAGGFVLSAETVAELERLDARALAPGSLRRALLLDRDGAGPDSDLRARLRRAGVTVTVGAGPGWEAMVCDPERPEPPLAVFELVAGWLAEAPQTRANRPSASAPGARDRRPAPAPAGAGALLDVAGASVRESSLVVRQTFGCSFGLLAEPAAGEGGGELCAVFLNAGAVRRIGPNRIWTEAARRWAARGICTARIDLEGIGDADGDGSRYRDVSELYAERFTDQVTLVLDELQARAGARRFVLIGLCSGGHRAFQLAALDERVSAALLVNAGALVWAPELVARRTAHRLERLRRLVWWKRILTGKVRLANIRVVLRALALSARRAPAAGGSGESVDELLDRLRDRATRVVLAFSGEEALHSELSCAGVLGRLERWPNVALERLPGRDHTLRSVVAQRAVHELLDRELARELELAQPAEPAGLAIR